MKASSELLSLLSSSLSYLPTDISDDSLLETLLCANNSNSFSGIMTSLTLGDKVVICLLYYPELKLTFFF